MVSEWYQNGIPGHPGLFEGILTISYPVVLIGGCDQDRDQWSVVPSRGTQVFLPLAGLLLTEFAV